VTLASRARSLSSGSRQLKSFHRSHGVREQLLCLRRPIELCQHAFECPLRAPARGGSHSGRTALRRRRPATAPILRGRVSLRHRRRLSSKCPLHKDRGGRPRRSNAARCDFSGLRGCWARGARARHARRHRFRIVALPLQSVGALDGHVVLECERVGIRRICTQGVFQQRARLVERTTRRFEIGVCPRCEDRTRERETREDECTLAAICRVIRPTTARVLRHAPDCAEASDALARLGLPGLACTRASRRSPSITSRRTSAGAFGSCASRSR